ncbi:MAG: hypothetical protein P8M80_13875 [Pirellulaceae bacterium]|nr:hypothetical protein [Pirellulaceae bacterium]
MGFSRSEVEIPDNLFSPQKKTPAGKLETCSQKEVMIRELMIVVLVGLVDGQTPRNLEDKLVAFVFPAHRTNGSS